MSKSSKVLSYAALIIGSALAAGIVWFTSISDRTDVALLRGLFALRGQLQPPEDVVLIAIDEDSYRELGLPLNQPFPRQVHAELLKRLSEYQPKAVVFDVIFADAGMDKEADRQLSEALTGVPVVIGADITRSSSGHVYEKKEWVLPYAPFSSAAKSVALVGFPEEFGVVSRFFTQKGNIGEHHDSLAEAAARLARENAAMPKPRDFISFYGPPGGIKKFSYYQVMEPEVPLPARFLENKVIFVGLILQTETGGAQKDSFLTPASRERMFGVEIHATAAANIMSDSWIRRLAPLTELSIVALVCALCGTLVIVMSPLKGACIAFGVPLTYLAAGALSFRNGCFLGGTLSVVAVPIPLYLGGLIKGYFSVLQAQRRTRRAFECYLAPEMVEQLVQTTEGTPNLGGELVEGTALFTDIAGFTTVCEKLSARAVSEMLNAYFTELMDAVFVEGGTLIKFIGDASFVIWGAPLPAKSASTQAVRAAVAIQERVGIFNRQGRFPALPTRVGIHSGVMLVGNLGAKRRFDYTAVGDTVNLASRVEGLNKYLGTRLLLTDEVHKRLEGPWPTLYLGKMQVVGKTEPIGLHTIFPSQLSPEVAEIWASGLRSFNNRQWSSATMLLDVAGQRSEHLDGAVKFYRKQIDRLSRLELDPDWSGEIEFDSK